MRAKRKSKKIGKEFFLPIIGQFLPKKFKSIKFLTYWHFLFRSELNHINRPGLTLALNCLDNKPAIIVETGTSAWGTDSTRLWASYVTSFGGRLLSVDIRSEPRDTLGNLGPNIELYVNDSVNFMKYFGQYEIKQIDLLYLDSFDIDWEDPYPAMQHGLQEFQSSEKFIGRGTIVVIDDTPNSLSWIPENAHKISKEIRSKLGVLPGKGALVFANIISQPSKYQLLFHDYNLVFKVLH